MLRLVLRQLLFDRVRSLLMVAVIGAVIAVILLLQGFAQGLYAQLRSVALERGGDLIAVQAGITSMTASRSVLPQLSRRDVEAVEGVRIAHPATSLPVIYERDGRKTPIFLFVYDTAGGPAPIVSGTAVRSERGIVIDEVLARRYGLAPGDDFVVSDFAFRVEGVVGEAAALFTPFAFVTYDGLLEFFFKADLAGDIATFPLLSYLLVELEDGTDRGAVATAIETAVPDVDVFTPAALARNDADVGRTLFGPILQLLTGIGYAAGVLVVGLFLFASVGNRTRELGVLKALGFTTRALFGSVLIEAAVVIALAAPLGIALARGVAAVIHALVPLYLVQPLAVQPLLATVLACVVFAALGAVLPVRAISRIDPAMVFRS